MTSVPTLTARKLIKIITREGFINVRNDIRLTPKDLQKLL